MRNLDKEFDLYARLVVLAENLMPMSPLSELARCYEDEVRLEDGTKTHQTENNNEEDDQA